MKINVKLVSIFLGLIFLLASGIAVASPLTVPQISTTTEPVLFLHSQVPGTPVIKTVTVQNTGTTALNLTSVSANFPWNVDSVSSTNIPAGGSATITVSFDVNAPGVYKDVLTIQSNDATNPTITVDLRALGLTNIIGGGHEPSLARVVDVHDITTTIGDDDVSTTTINSNAGIAFGPIIGDEVSMQLFQKAGPGNVTIEPLGVFAVDGNPILNTGWYPATTGINQFLFSVDPGSHQSIEPSITGTTSFDPGTGNAFGLWTQWVPAPWNGRITYSEDSRNTFSGGEHHVRVFPLETASGVEPNAFIVAHEENTAGFDYNDIVYIIRNVQPATFTASNIRVENRDWVQLNNQNIAGFNYLNRWLTFQHITPSNVNQPQWLAPLTLRTHNRVTVRIHNDGGTPLNVTGFNFSNNTYFFLPNGETGFTVAPGGFRDVVVGMRGDTGLKTIRYETLTIVSDDPGEPNLILQLVGGHMLRPEGGHELITPEQAEVLGFTMDLGFASSNPPLEDVLALYGYFIPYGEEVMAPFWERLNPSQPVYVRQLASFRGCCQGSVTNFFIRDTANNVIGSFGHASQDGQSMLPLLNGADVPAEGLYNPSGAFKFQVSNLHSDAYFRDPPAPVGLRFWPVRNPSGQIVPGAYMMGQDFIGTSNFAGGNRDYNDNTYLITNIQPAAYTQTDFVIIPTTGPNGTIDADTPRLKNAGENQTFFFYPDPGYEISQVLVDFDLHTPGGQVPVALTGSNFFTFTNVQTDMWIHAEFAPAGTVFTVTPSAGPNGSIDPATALTVAQNGNATFNFTPDAGFQVDTVTVDDGGGPVTVTPTGNSYTITNIQSDTTINVTFQPLVQQTVNVTVGANGSATDGTTTFTTGTTPAGYPQNSTPTFTFTPDAGFVIDSVLFNGAPQTLVGNSVTLPPLTADGTLVVNFTPVPTYALNVIVGANGTADNGPTNYAAGTTTVETVTQGDTPTFVFTPDTGYQIDDVQVNGISVTLTGNSYTFPPITAANTIEVTYSPIPYTLALTVGANGTATDGGSTYTAGSTTNIPVLGGDTPGFTFNPAVGFEIDELLLDGATVLPTGNTYTLAPITADTTLEVTFQTIQNTINVIVGVGGSADSGATNFAENTITNFDVAANSTPTFTFTPNATHVLNEVTVDGTPVTLLGNSYTFPPVTADATLEVTFTELFTLTPSAGANGSISPATPQDVPQGSDFTFTFIPDLGFEIDTVTVDLGDGSGPQVVAVAGNSYTFTNVQNDGTIDVTFAVFTGPTFTLTPSAGANGSITPATVQTVPQGSDFTFTFTPDPGHDVGTVTINTGIGDQVVTPVGNTYTFTNVQSDSTIDVQFTPILYTLTPSTDGNGTITPNTPQSVPFNTDFTFTFTPNPGFVLDTVLVDLGDGSGPQAVTPVGNSYTFTAVQNDGTIDASFVPTQYTLTPSAGANGQITPNTPQTVNFSDNFTFNFLPDANYQVDTVTVDLGDGSGPQVVTPTGNSYTFTNVQNDGTIDVTFAPINYTLTPSAGANGQILPATPQTVQQGNNFTFTFVPDPGFVVDTVTVNVGTGPQVVAVAGNTYTFANVQNNGTINVTFAAIAGPTFTLTPSTDPNGEITPNTPVTVPQGSDYTFLFTPDPGYQLDTVTVDLGDGSGPQVVTVVGNSYTFTNVQNDGTIDVTFAPISTVTYTLNPTLGANGSVVPGGPQTVFEGTNFTFTIVPDPGFVIDTVTVDLGDGSGPQPVTLTPLNEYTFVNVQADGAIAITFIQEPSEYGDFVWNDQNANGVQDAGEPGVENVVVKLMDTTGVTELDRVLTDATGFFALPIPPGDFIIEIEPPTGYNLAPAAQGGDPLLDSDFTVATRSIPVTVAVRGLTFPDDADAGLIFDPTVSPPLVDPPVTTDNPQPQPASVPVVNFAGATAFANQNFVAKVAEPSIGSAGDTVTYTIVLGNPLTETISPTVEDVFDGRLENIQIVSASKGNPVLNGNTLSMTGFTLAPGENVTIVVTAQISGNVRPGDVIPNVATLSYNPTFTSNTATVTILPGSLPNTGETPVWRTPLLIALVSIGLLGLFFMMLRVRRKFA